MISAIDCSDEILSLARTVEAGTCMKAFNLLSCLEGGNARIMGAADNEHNVPFKAECGGYCVA
ncbi:MAG: hypothetical protein ACE5R6_09865 [Candidatus Heimdallarchaeota archaeon]